MQQARNSRPCGYPIKSHSVLVCVPDIGEMLWVKGMKSLLHGPDILVKKTNQQANKYRYSLMAGDDEFYAERSKRKEAMENTFLKAVVCKS